MSIPTIRATASGVKKLKAQGDDAVAQCIHPADIASLTSRVVSEAFLLAADAWMRSFTAEEAEDMMKVYTTNTGLPVGHGGHPPPA